MSVRKTATVVSGSFLILWCLAASAQTTGSDGALTAVLNDQQPENPVPIGTSVAYTITITNTDPAGGTIGTGVLVYVNDVLQAANSGVFSADGCRVDSAFPSAWACNNLTSAVPEQTYALTWLAPDAGPHSLRFEVIGQRPIDNIGAPDFLIQLVRQSIVGSNSPVVTIVAPNFVDDTDGQSGEDIQATGSAVDAEDGTLPPTSFRWFVNNTEIVGAAGQETPTLSLLDGVNTVGLEATDSDNLTAQAEVQVSVTAAQSPTTFNDVPTDYWAHSSIEALAASGVTGGCGGGNYCPEDLVTRAQMAVFLERGMNGSDFSPPPATGTLFLDVGAMDFAASFIERLFLDGVTGGCGGGNYCPADRVTRAQMAVFLLRAEHGASYSPPIPAGVFGDVDLNHWAVAWVEQLAAEGITGGCGGGNYCPEAAVTRAQMAVFLVRAFSLDSPPAVCEKAVGGGSGIVAEPALLATLFDRWHEAWLGSPAIADIDADGEIEILVPRSNLLLGWHLDNQIVFSVDVEEGRIYSSPVVADLVPEAPGLEVAVAAGAKIHAYDSNGTELSGFPYQWQQELRSLAAADIDGDGRLELVAASTNVLTIGGQSDNMIAVNDDGSLVAGFPPNTSGLSGCDESCAIAGAFGQNIALGDLNGDDQADILVTHDNPYMSVHEGDGRAFDAAAIFEAATKFSGIRFLHDYTEAQLGWAPNEEAANQTSFTRSAPAIADIDRNGSNEIVVLGSVQNAALDDRERGVALWVINNDGTRPDAWVTPFHASDYLAGLYDFAGTNVVGATNEVAIADITAASDGLEMIFAGFDGRIHAVDSNANEIWSTTYTTSLRELTSGVVVADLSGDGIPEIVFSSYSPDEDVSSLVVLDANGVELHRIPLSGRGAMPVPTIADVNGDSQLEIVVSLKDGTDGISQVLVYTVPGSSNNCLPWPTGRGGNLRNGFFDRN